MTPGIGRGDHALPLTLHSQFEPAHDEENVATRAMEGRSAEAEPLRFVIVGGGPRGMAQAAAQMAFLHEHADDFRELQAKGADYRLSTVVVEQQQTVGDGQAWGDKQGGGTVNTAAEKSGLFGLPNRIREFYASQGDALLAKYEAENPVAAATLRSALDGSEGVPGVPITHRGVVTRADLGHEAKSHYQDLRAQTASAVPFWTFTEMTGARATGVDLSDPKRPAVSIERMGTGGASERLQGDVVRLTTGTTMASPVKDPAVLEHSFIAAMDPAKLGEFFAGKDLLDESGSLRSGVRLALGGSSLSAIDQAIAVCKFMGVLVPDANSPIGYAVDPEKAARYQDAITFISATPGKWVPPRHADGAAWTQQTAPFGTTQHLHALYLNRNGEGVSTAWHTLERASAAVAAGTTPRGLQQLGLSTHELWAAQQAGNQRVLTLHQQSRDASPDTASRLRREATQTLEGARRQAFAPTRSGLGMPLDPVAERKKMEDMAPLTYKGRDAYLYLRGHEKVSTDAASLTSQGNAHLLRPWATRMHDITSSPTRVHALVPMLHEAGIASYLPGTYDRLRATTGSGLSFRSSSGVEARFDAFIVSPVFSRAADPVAASLEGQVTPVHPEAPSYPEVGTHRRILSSEGVLSHLEDYGMSGGGARVRTTLSGEEIQGGRFAEVGKWGSDVNNRASGYEEAGRSAIRDAALAHLNAAGLSSPVRRFDEFLSAIQPTQEAFEAEAAQFEPAFREAHSVAAFLEGVAQAAKDDPQLYAQLAEQARTKVSRQTALFQARMGGNQELATALQQYADTVDNPPAFEPDPNYFDRFTDVPLHVQQAAYQQALQAAREALEARAQLS